MSIKKLSGTITKITDLSKTAKDIEITLTEGIGFLGGNFVNLFMDVNGENVRRAFSISSSDAVQDVISLSIRESLNGVMSPEFWKHDLTGTTVELMGPLGVNTADKMQSPKAYLFAYGVGTGVVRSVLDHIIRTGIAKKIVVMTGSRSEDEILHRKYFDSMAMNYPFIEVRHIISTPTQNSNFRIGYIQDHIDGIDFNNADVYACGQKKACDSLLEKINAQSPKNCNLSIESFG